MTELKNKLANKAAGTPAKQSKGGMEHMLTLMATEIKRALPENIKSERFQRIALTAFNGNPKLQECNPTSFLAAMMQSAQLGLEPNTPLGQAYLIPFKDGKSQEMRVQFQIGYKGLLDLANRTREYKAIYCHTVHENDEFDISYGLDQKLIHKPYLEGDRGQAIGYYAVYKLINGGEGFSYMTKEEILNHAQKFSKTFKFGPWQTDFDAMAKKTVLKQALKYAPLATELQQATAIDEKTVNDEAVKTKSEDKFIEVDWADVTETVNEETGEING